MNIRRTVWSLTLRHRRTDVLSTSSFINKFQTIFSLHSINWKHSVLFEKQSGFKQSNTKPSRRPRASIQSLTHLQYWWSPPHSGCLLAEKKCLYRIDDGPTLGEFWYSPCQILSKTVQYIDTKHLTTFRYRPTCIFQHGTNRWRPIHNHRQRNFIHPPPRAQHVTAHSEIHFTKQKS